MDQIGEEHFPWTGKDEVEDSRDRAVGMYGEKMDLFCGKYIKNKYKTDVLIKKGVNLKKETFEMLSNFYHQNAVSILDFYPEGGNHGRFVISKVDTSFSAWMKAVGKPLMFDANGQMTSLLRNMVIDLCDLVLSLFDKGIVSVNCINMEELYMKISHDGTQKLVLLLTEVKKPQYPSHDVKASWNSIRKLINSFCIECGVELNNWGKNFIDFIGKETFTIKKLKNYPDTWDYTMKGEYLLSLHSANQSVMRPQFKSTGVQWPFSGRGRVLPDLLNQIIEGAENNGYQYNENDPYEYNMLLKNAYKHFGELPEAVQSTLVNPEGLLKQIELWSPDIWKKLYEIIVVP